MSWQRKSTTKLPRALLEELGEPNVDERTRSRRGGSRGKPGRKELRKQERTQAKARRTQFYTSDRLQAPTHSAEEPLEQPEAKRRKVQDSQARNPGPSTKTGKELKPPSLEKRSSNALNDRGKSQVEFDEDAYISMLEKKLGVRKGKQEYGFEEDSDGLLDILGDLDEDQDSALDDDDDDELPAEGESESSSSSSHHEDEWRGFASGDSDDDAESVTQGAYVPPQARTLRHADPPEENVKLKRTLKGLLNRLSEPNMDNILKEMEGLFRAHSRHDLMVTLTDLILDGTCSQSVMLDSFVALHSGLLACLHKIFGVEIAAFFIQKVVASFEDHYNRMKSNIEEGSTDVVGKECLNLLTLLSDLYTFHVISCNLIYDIIRLLLDGDLSELDVELILKLTRGCGVQLRQDDPSSLKDIVQMVQSKVSSQAGTSSRTKFMIETLNNLKNNKIRQQHNGGVESKDRIIKFVSGVGKKYHVASHEPLRFSLDDLHQADTKGRWWLVGAAWGGNPLVDGKESRTKVSSASKVAENQLLTLAKKQGMNTEIRRSIFVVLMSSDDYVDACERLSHLNLKEIQQREIVRVLLHCCGNESNYNPYYALIGQRFCQTSHGHKITLQYCFWDFLRSIGETTAGGTQMIENLADHPDPVDSGSVSPSRIANVARVYAWWIAKNSVDLTILKTINFVSMKSRTRGFLEQLCVTLFLLSQDDTLSPVENPAVATKRREAGKLQEILIRTLRLPALVNGLVMFLSKRFKSLAGAHEGTREFVAWACEMSREILKTVPVVSNDDDY